MCISCTYRLEIRCDTLEHLLSKYFDNCLLQLREGNFFLSECHANSPHAPKDGNALDGGIVNSSTAAISGTKTHETQAQMTLRQDKYPSQRRIPSTDETKGLNCSSERTTMKRSFKPKVVSHSNEIEQLKYQKSRTTASKEQLSSDAEPKTQTARESGRLMYYSRRRYHLFFPLPWCF